MLVLALLLTCALENDPELKKGQDQIEAFEYEKAAATFDAVSKRPGLTDADRALALVWLGLAFAELRDQARASVAFEDAVTADPLIVLPRDASPKIKTLLEDARARVRLRPKVDTHPKPPPESTAKPPAKPPDDGGARPPAIEGSPLVPVGIGAAVVGGVVALAGGGVWGFGLLLKKQADAEPFQSTAAVLRSQSLATQVGGQVTAGVGVAALAAGGVLLVLGTME